MEMYKIVWAHSKCSTMSCKMILILLYPHHLNMVWVTLSSLGSLGPSYHLT